LCRLVGEVGDDYFCSDVQSQHGVGCLFRGGRVVPSVNDDVRSRCRQLQSDRPPDSARGTGHHGDAIGQFTRDGARHANDQSHRGQWASIIRRLRTLLYRAQSALATGDFRLGVAHKQNVAANSPCHPAKAAQLLKLIPQLTPGE
jgi:hypothetical protein